MTLKYIEHFILASPVTGSILTSAFPSSRGFSIGITGPVIGLKICAISAAVKSIRQ